MVHSFIYNRLSSCGMKKKIFNVLLKPKRGKAARSLVGEVVMQTVWQLVKMAVFKGLLGKNPIQHCQLLYKP